MEEERYAKAKKWEERKERRDVGELVSRKVKLEEKVGKQGKGSGMKVRKLANKGV
jgi:hypothetical protein